jgi:hypothetical protein
MQATDANLGILGLEVYFPSTYVEQEALGMVARATHALHVDVESYIDGATIDVMCCAAALPLTASLTTLLRGAQRSTTA